MDKNSNTRHWPSRRGQHRGPNVPPKPGHRVVEETLKVELSQWENKFFIAKLKQNPRGRFVRISEDAKGWHNAILIPESGLREFHQLLTEMIEASDALPPRPPTDPKGG